MFNRDSLFFEFLLGLGPFWVFSWVEVVRNEDGDDGVRRIFGMFLWFLSCSVLLTSVTPGSGRLSATPVLIGGFKCLPFTPLWSGGLNVQVSDTNLVFWLPSPPDPA